MEYYNAKEYGIQTSSGENFEVFIEAAVRGRFGSAGLTNLVIAD